MTNSPSFTHTKVTVSFDKPGVYVVSATGTINDDVTIDWTTYETKKMDCPITAPCCVVTVAADPIDVYVTISNKGTLALASQKVKVTDVNKDSIISFDEALLAAHKKYYKDGDKGYATKESTFGPMVTKLWGVEIGGNAYLYQNDESIPASVAVQPVKANDYLVAGSLVDTTNWTDNYACFNKKTVDTAVGKKFTLKLTAKSTFPPSTVNAAKLKVGTWKDGKFKAIKGKVTGKDGKVTLSFDKAGTYYISASGKVKNNNASCPIIAPCCVVKVAKAANPIKVTVAKKTATISNKNVTVAPITVKNAKGTKTFKVTKWTTKNAKKYMKVNKKTGKVTVKKSAKAGTYKFKVKVTAKGNSDYKSKSVTKTVTVKVKK